MTHPELPVSLFVCDTVCHYRLTFDQGIYAVSDEDGEEQARIARRPNGSWYRVSGKHYPAPAIERMGEAIDEFEFLTEHSFGFGLELNGHLLYCEILLGEHGYYVYLNHQLIGEIRMSFDLSWEAVSGNLPPACLLPEIGKRIEKHFI